MYWYPSCTVTFRKCKNTVAKSLSIWRTFVREFFVVKRLKADAADLWLAKAQDTGPLTNWISDAHPQGGTDVQSPVSCLDYRDVVSDAVCSHISVVSEVHI